ncbi:MAG: aminotransferase class I/II-fold pyridoxal phosphate-dependent enzyme [Gammaproteobacteria bacterium]|nr:aminotransferase class I/II-fold pyridoxal phosphate-dependent enzyme [Gammaproteobacteria bacterium]
MLLSVEALKNKGLYRERQLRQAELDFSSNDYLALSNDLRLKPIFQQAFADYPLGSGGSTVICGYHAAHRQVEAAFCDALEVESAMLFNSGYVANLAIMALLAQLGHCVIMDKSSHASFYDGLKLSGGKLIRYPHQRYDLFEQHWSKASEPLWVTESVFSMGGHLTPFDTLAPMTPMIVDEAHAFGLYGHEGLGRVQACGLTQCEVPLRVIPLGKACGAQGAVVAGQAQWVNALLQVARGAIYSTAMSPAYAAALPSVLQFVREADEQRGRLFENVAFFKLNVLHSPLSWLDSETPIQHLVLGNSAKAIGFAEQLGKQGLFCRAIRPPTVSLAHTGLRIVLHADHTQAQILRLLEIIHQVAEHDSQD